MCKNYMNNLCCLVLLAVGYAYAMDPLTKEQAATLSSALHPRLGQESAASLLDDNLVRMICMTTFPEKNITLINDAETMVDVRLQQRAFSFNERVLLGASAVPWRRPRLRLTHAAAGRAMKVFPINLFNGTGGPERKERLHVVRVNPIAPRGPRYPRGSTLSVPVASLCITVLDAERHMHNFCRVPADILERARELRITFSGVTPVDQDGRWLQVIPLDEL